MSVQTSPTVPANGQHHDSLATTGPPGRLWLLGPWLDTLFIANVAWPLLLLLQLGEGFSGREGVQFWQIYFLTTPHRWITLALVFLDREQFARRRATFLIIAATAILVCVSIRITTGALTCLLTIDYLWNAWHFASQHHGIYRIYTRRMPAGSLSASPTTLWLIVEKWTMRLFLLYIILRVAAAIWPYPQLERILQTTDWAVLAVPAWLLVREAVRAAFNPGAMIYLASVSVLFTALLAAVHFNQPAMVLSLTTASAVFHATEYLALVTWAAKGKQAAPVDRVGVLGYFLPRWGLTLGIFILVLGSSAWLLQRHLLQTWLLLNVIVAFLHYAYDGLIWRRR